MAQRDRVLRVEGILVHVGAAGEVEGRAARGEVVGNQAGLVVGEAGFGDAERETFVQPRLYELRADLHVVDLVHVVVVGAHSVIGKAAVFADRGRRVGERIARGIVVHLIAAQEDIDREQGAGAEGVLISRRDVVGENLLALVLIGLVECVGHLEPVARGQQVEVKSVARGGLPVETVEDGFAVPHVVERTKLRRVEKAPAAQGIGGEEVAKLLAAEAEGGLFADRAEGTVLRGEAAEGLLAQSGTRHGVDHQAGLVAELRARRAGDQLHRLNGVERNLRGELLALLIGDRLSVDRKAGLRVIAQRVEEAVGIGHHAGARQRDRVAQSAAWGGGGQLRIELAIHVVVRVRERFRASRRRSLPP